MNRYTILSFLRWSAIVVLFAASALLLISGAYVAIMSGTWDGVPTNKDALLALAFGELFGLSGILLLPKNKASIYIRASFDTVLGMVGVYLFGRGMGVLMSASAADRVGAVILFLGIGALVVFASVESLVKLSRNRQVA